MNRRAKRGCCLSVAGSLGSLLWVGSAHAQTAAPDPRTQAAELLRDAEQLASAGNASAACLKYRDSASLDAQLDALLPWARCLEKDGKLASAYAAFADAADVARRTGDPRLASAEQAAASLRPRVSFLTIDVPSDRRLPALSIERDGFRVGSSSWGVPLPIDPGQHVITVRAFGYREFQTTIEVQGDAAQPAVEVPLLEKNEPPLPVAPAAPPVAAKDDALGAKLVPPPPVLSAAVPPAPRPFWNAQRVIAVSAAGAGVIGAGLGVYFLTQRNSTLDDRDGICPSGKDCAPGTNARLAELTAQARSHQRAEVTSFALAGAGAALALGLWFWPQSQRGDRQAFVAPVLSPSAAGLVLGGRL